MNWEELAAIAEIASAVAVIVTLLYVAKEIHQNSRSLAITALRNTTEQWNEWSNMLASSPDLADIVARGNLSPESLSDSEALRYGAYIQAFFDNVESYRSLVVDHNVEKDLGVLTRIVARRINSPGVVAWWVDNTDDYDSGFVAWVNGIRGSQAPEKSTSSKTSDGASVLE